MLINLVGRARFIRFCIVGGIGVLVDMTILRFLTDTWPGLSLGAAKLVSGEAALTHNFVWNEVWTFHDLADQQRSLHARLRRLLHFHWICGIGIGIAIPLLYIFSRGLGLPLWLANGLSIVLATLWNFLMNARLNWRTAPTSSSLSDLKTRFCRKLANGRPTGPKRRSVDPSRAEPMNRR